MQLLQFLRSFKRPVPTGPLAHTLLVGVMSSVGA